MGIGKNKMKTESTENIIAKWPQWKKDIHICDSQIRVGSETICSCTHPERVRAIREQERLSRRAYSYWPGD